MKVMVIPIPDDDGYQVVVPQFPNCTTWGETRDEAFANGKEAMELILEELEEIDLSGC